MHCSSTPKVLQDGLVCRAINIPTALVEALELHACTHDRHPLLIHVSTDQVYDGSKAHWRESDACEPVNTYGRTKLQAERFLQVQHMQACVQGLVIWSVSSHGHQCMLLLPAWALCWVRSLWRCLRGLRCAGAVGQPCDPQELHHLWPPRSTACEQVPVPPGEPEGQLLRLLGPWPTTCIKATATSYQHLALCMTAARLCISKKPCPGREQHLCWQFILRALAAGKPTTFFCDEFRSPIYVEDICTVVAAVTEARARLSHDDSPRCRHPSSEHQPLPKADCYVVCGSYSLDRPRSSQSPQHPSTQTCISSTSKPICTPAVSPQPPAQAQ